MLSKPRNTLGSAATTQKSFATPIQSGLTSGNPPQLLQRVCGIWLPLSKTLRHLVVRPSLHCRLAFLLVAGLSQSLKLSLITDSSLAVPPKRYRLPSLPQWRRDSQPHHRQKANTPAHQGWQEPAGVVLWCRVPILLHAVKNQKKGLASL